MNVKQIVSYLVVFILGGALSFAAFGGGSTDGLQGSLQLRPTSSTGNLQISDERRGPNFNPTKELRKIDFNKDGVRPQTDKPKPQGVCTVTTCNLMDRLNEIHNQIGTPTYTLSSMLATIDANVRYIYDALNYSSSSMQTRLVDIQNKLGHGTWTLDTIAGQIGNQVQIVDYIKQHVIGQNPNELNNATWTLNSLAQHIATVCR